MPLPLKSAIGILRSTGYQPVSSFFLRVFGFNHFRAGAAAAAALLGVLAAAMPARRAGRLDVLTAIAET